MEDHSLKNKSVSFLKVKKVAYLYPKVNKIEKGYSHFKGYSRKNT